MPQQQAKSYSVMYFMANIQQKEGQRGKREHAGSWSSHIKATLMANESLDTDMKYSRGYKILMLRGLCL